MSETKVYVVMGATGEYSDKREWPVMAYLDESEAEAHSDAAKKRAHEIEKALDGEYYGVSKKEPNEHDPAMDMDYTGTEYYVLRVPLAARKEQGP